MNDQVPVINRIAAVVQPKEPYYVWARAFDDDGSAIDSMTIENLTSVYLIDDDDNPERALRRHWDWIFEEKLCSWHTDCENWPAKRSYRMFRKWFDVRLVSLVFDLPLEPLLREDF